MFETPISLQTPKQQAFDLFKKGDIQGSLNMFNANLKDNQHDPWYMHDRARVMVEAGGTVQVKQAVKDLEVVHKELPKDAQVAVSLSIAAGRAGDVRRCLEYNKLAQELDPNNHEVAMVNDILTTGKPDEQAHKLHDRALSYFQKGEYREALRYYDLAVAVGGEGNAVWSLHDKGIALMRLGQFEDAVKILNRTKELLPASPIPNLDLAILYEHIGLKIRDTQNVANYPINQIRKGHCLEALRLDPNNKVAIAILDKMKIENRDMIKHSPYQQVQQKDGSSLWLDENGKPVKRNVDRERATIGNYLDEIKQTDPDYYAYLERLAKLPTMHSMENGCRVSVNIPAWMEGKNMYGLLDTYCKQVSNAGNRLLEESYEINVIFNRKLGTPPDNSIDEIKRFIADRQAKGERLKINYLDVVFVPPFNNVGHSRKLLTDLTLLRSHHRRMQFSPLYIESEDADLTHVDPKTISNIIHKMDNNPHLDAVRGVQDRSPEILKDNDYLMLKRRLWDIGEVLIRSKKYRPDNNPKWNSLWNRVVTGGWNTAYSAEAYALIGGYENLSKGEDMDIGMRITEMRAKPGEQNLDVIGTVSTRSSSSPRRFVEELYSQQAAYGDSFEDPTINGKIKNATVEELMESIKFTERINPENIEFFSRLIERSIGFYRSVTPNEVEARKLMKRIMFFLGFQPTDYGFTDTGNIRILNWRNIQQLLENYRTNFVPSSKLFEMNKN